MTGTWKRVTMPEGFTRSWAKNMGDTPMPEAYESGTLRALVGREPVTPDDTRWHISLSTDIRVPTWQELSTAAHELRPGVPFAIGVPPKSWWINVHQHTLHLWEVKDEHLIAQWRFEGRGDKPT